jgi:AcrR family transcriptional regulator
MTKQEKKELIITSARFCFLNFGYKATTMELIAKTAKMGKGTFYNFFLTKEEVLNSVMEQEIEGLNCLAEKTKNIEPFNEEALLFYLKQALNYIKQGDLFHKLVVEAESIGTPEVSAALAKVNTVAFQKMKELVTLFVQSKEIRKCDIELTTFLLLDIYCSLVYRWQAEHEPLSEERIQEVFMKLYPLV